MPSRDTPESEPAHQQPYSHVTRVARLIDAGRLDLAERAAHDGLLAHPHHADLHSQLAAVRLRQDRYDEAVAAATDALAIDAEHDGATMVLGSALMMLGRNSEAERVFLDALRRDPDAPQFLRQYGILLHRVGELDKAVRVLQRSLALDPDDDTAHRVLTLILTEQGRHGDAAKHGERALAEAPDEAFSHVALAVAQFHSGHPLRARALLREALRLDPDQKTEESFVEVDKLTRWPGLPMYWWALLVQRLPGKQFTVWIALVISLRVMPMLGVPSGVVGGVAIGYLVLVLYTWFAMPFLRLWVKLLPPR